MGDSVWFTNQLSERIMEDAAIFDSTGYIVTDLVTGKLDITSLVENMAVVLKHTQEDKREKGMRFYSKILKELPKNFLKEIQLKFIAKFYADRLKEHHSIIPSVLEGYLAIIEMTNYNINDSSDFLVILFREVSCQSQLRQDRLHIYMIIQKLLHKDPQYCKKLGPDFVYGLISAMDGERDPRNLQFLFEFLPNFLTTVPLGHLVEEMFDVISCYYPVDFNPSPNDPACVTRDELAAALCPCLCAVPEFAEQCLILLVEKLDSNLRLAKYDSLKSLATSCKTFKGEAYGPFIKTLWPSIQKEINHKTDEEMSLAGHEALSALIAKLSTVAETDNSFEQLVKTILVSNQTAIAAAKTVAEFVQSVKILLTAAKACKESCIVVTRCMIPSTISYYEFKTSTKLQIASLDFIGDMYDAIKHWDVTELVKTQVNEIPALCFTAVSSPVKDFQIAGLRTLIRIKDVLLVDHVLPFIDILIQNIQHSQDADILAVTVETVHAIARKYPEVIMSLVVRGKCNLDNVFQDKSVLQKRLHLLTNLASIDEFTKVIIEDILKIITAYNKETNLVVEALNESMMLASYSKEKVQQIESDHGLIEPILAWLYKEIPTNNYDILVHGFTLVSNTVGSLPAEKQQWILSKHTQTVLEKCQENDTYFLIIECLYSPLHQNLYSDKHKDIMVLALQLCLGSDKEIVRSKACILIAHILNKVEYGQKFELLYELLKTHLATCNKQDESLCPRLIYLYGWLTKALIMRGSDFYNFWLQKIINILQNHDYSKLAAEAIRTIMTESDYYMSSKQHCRSSLLYKQRMFVSFLDLTKNLNLGDQKKNEDYYASWAYVLNKVPKTVLNNEAIKIAPIVIDSLDYEDKEMLLITLDVLAQLIKAQPFVSDSLQTILPKLINLTRYVKSMDVRIKSLECLCEIANTYRTSLLLPFKQDVLLDLAPSLDDKKRLVRNMAVKARTRWFLVGAPGEDKPN